MGTIDLLERAAADPDPEIRRAALRASAKLGHPAAERWILPALKRSDHIGPAAGDRGERFAWPAQRPTRPDHDAER
jgi:HEAT repeat protein